MSIPLSMIKMGWPPAYSYQVEIRRDPRIWSVAHQLVDDKKAIDINWAILDLGAQVCTPRSPECNACAIKASCRFAKTVKLPSTS
jgi:adenine-specific DNA glycosylase